MVYKPSILRWELYGGFSLLHARFVSQEESDSANTQLLSHHFEESDNMQKVIPIQGLEPWYPAWNASMLTTYIISECPMMNVDSSIQSTPPNCAVYPFYLIIYNWRASVLSWSKRLLYYKYTLFIILFCEATHNFSDALIPNTSTCSFLTWHSGNTRK